MSLPSFLPMLPIQHRKTQCLERSAIPSALSSGPPETARPMTAKGRSKVGHRTVGHPATKRPIRRRLSRPFGTATCPPFWVGCPRVSCTTIPSWTWPGYWATVAASARGLLPSCGHTTCSMTSSDVPAMAMTRGKSMGWWDTRGETSWRRCHGWRVRGAECSLAICYGLGISGNGG